MQKSVCLFQVYHLLTSIMSKAFLNSEDEEENNVSDLEFQTFILFFPK